MNETAEATRLAAHGWPNGTWSGAEAGQARGRGAETGLTRRGFLIGAGLTAGALLAGGLLIDRVGPLRGWTDEVQKELADAGVFHALHGATVREYTLDSRYVDEPVPYAIAWPPGASAGDPLPVCYALPGRGGGPPMGFADAAADVIKADETPPYAVVGVHGGVSYWHRRADGEDRLSMLLDEIVPLCAEEHRLGATVTSGRSSVGPWAATARCSPPRRSRASSPRSAA